jgi:flagellar motor switch protein FliG
VTRVLAPNGGIKKSNKVQGSDLIDRLKLADDVSVQKFIVAMGEDDILIFLEYAEEDAVLLKKFYDNMSERSCKMYAEDIAYKFQNGIPAGQLDDTVSRLVRMAQKMEEDGRLTFTSAKAEIAEQKRTGYPVL